MRTDLQRLIVGKWFLSIEELAKRSKVGKDTVRRALEGEKVLPRYEERLRAFLENYTGEEQ